MKSRKTTYRSRAVLSVVNREFPFQSGMKVLELPPRLLDHREDVCVFECLYLK